VLRAQVERSKMEEMRLVLQQQRRSLAAGLNTLLYRPVTSEVPTIDHAELTATSLDAAELERLAEEHRPLLRSLVARIDKSKAERALADKEFYPDFTLAFEYMQKESIMNDPGYDMYNASVSFNLPLQRERRHAMVAESEAAQRMAGDELNMTRNNIRQVIANLLAHWSATARWRVCIGRESCRRLGPPWSRLFLLIVRGKANSCRFLTAVWRYSMSSATITRRWPSTRWNSPGSKRPWSPPAGQLTRNL